MTETRRAHDWSEQDNRMVLVHFAHLLERKIHEKSTEHQKHKWLPDTGVTVLQRNLD